MTTKKDSKVCAACGKNPRRKHTRGRCTECALDKGYRVCSKCRRMYVPSRAQQRSCGKCFNRGKSVWSVASAGAPTLGKRK